VCRLILVDQRANGRSGRPPEGSWTLAQNAADVGLLAQALGLSAYAVLGHSYGAFVALQQAVSHPGAAAQTIVSSGVPGSAWLMPHVKRELAAFEPLHLREQVRSSWAREPHAQTPEDVAALIHDQLPFHFADPLDARIADFERRTAGMVFGPEVLRKTSAADYGGIEVEDRLAQVTQSVLVLAGRFDRTCSVAASERMAAGLPRAELHVFERSGHMTFAEEPEAYVAAVRGFLRRHGAV
jgi:proline iminopeptidase